MASGLLGIGISGLQVNQAALTTTGHNITNANTEGYSRQRIVAEANNPIYKGAGYFGTGANLQSIERIANEFLNKQLRMDTSAYNSLESYTSKISQLDNMIANPASGLVPSLDEFFTALQSASSDPTSLPARQLVINQAESLSTRFNSIYAQLDNINEQINQETTTYTADLNALLEGVAEINQQIHNSQITNGIPVNDFLDRRDELIREISEIVQVNTVEQPGGMVDLFMGGQALVLGVDASRLEVIPGQTDPGRVDVVLRSSHNDFIVTNNLGGGKLGGLIDFRSVILDEAYNTVGKIALGVSEAFNAQQANGLDLNGEYGQELFSNINDPSLIYSRVVMGSYNAQPSDQVVAVTIDNSDELTSSDYMVRFTDTSGNAYEVLRISDQSVVTGGSLSSARPETISVDGFTVHIQSGTFSQGDIMRIQPTRTAGREISVNPIQPESLAFAAPVTINTPLGNTGSGVASEVDMLGIIDPSTGARLPLFTDSNNLSPPLVIRFTSPTTYDVLDNSDPSNPKPLQPPINDQMYVPGLNNSIFASEPGQTLMVSDGFNAGRLTGTITSVPPDPIPANAYIAETMNLTYTDPATGLRTTYPSVSIPAGASAEQIAQTLSMQTGLNAQASTYMELQLTDDGAGQPLQLTLNGIDLTATAPPSPVTPDYIANAINNDASLQSQGIRAVSDGSTIKVFSASGGDFNLLVTGDATDSVVVKGDAGAELQSTTDVTSGVNFDVGAPTSFTIDIGGGPRTINLSGQFSDQQSVVNYLQSQINSAFNSPSVIEVSAGPNGTIEFSTFNTSHNATLAIGGVTNDVLGLASAAAAGTVTPNDMVTVLGVGAGISRAITVGGEVSVTLDEGFTLSSNAVGQGNVFSSQSQAASNYFGFNFSISGYPDTGDTFELGFNSNGVSDNRNAVKMLALQETGSLNDGTSFSDSYGELVSKIGSLASQALINRDASAAILEQSQGLRDSISGVNLDEEAANLIKYEMAYTASSRVISVAQDIIDALFEALR